MRRIALHIFGWAAVLGMAGCAQVGAPDGGGRDQSAPVVMASDPPFGTVDFEGTGFTLTFDEFVQLQDARRQLLVSPPLPSPPRALVRGRSVHVDLGGKLLPDRTYIVQFGDAVRDLREGNVAKGLTYVFSTGARLDSGRVAGRAVDAWTGEPAAGARVLLYADTLPEGILDPALPDSLRPLPDYVGMLDDSGRFVVDFLPEQAFHALVLDDVNANYRADQGEPVAWWTEGFRAAADSAGAGSEREVARMDAPPLLPTTFTAGVEVDSSGYFRARMEGLAALGEGPDGLADEALELRLEGPDGPVELGREGDSIWALLPRFDPLQPSVWTLTHPSGVDTLAFRSIGPAVAPFAVGRTDGRVSAGGYGTMRFAPIPLGLDTGRCSARLVVEDDTVIWRGRGFSLVGAEVRVGPLPEGADVEVLLEPGALLGARATEDSVEWKVDVRRNSEVGTIRVMADTARIGPQEVWWLTDGVGWPMYDQPMGRDGRFNDVLPGRYGLVRIVDLDGNGRWTGADPANGRPPEPVDRLPRSVEVRAGWEIEVVPGFHPRP